ncbi:amidohydrolase family protein [Xenophilus azovorans]|uniref:amidohydrolase family protein n=1 Tax=Xenophilus azovorans TaxID=151755 RepID=UPI0006893467|nr:amidohydrolase family protein [Xenophilus azovorans]
MIIDLHAHALGERFLHDLARTPVAGLRAERGDDGYWVIRRHGDDRKSSIDPNLHDLPGRIDSLKRRNVELQLFAPPPFMLAWPDGAAGTELVRALNRASRDIAADSEGRMEMLAVLALGEPEVAVQELQRAVDEYGVRGVMMPSSAGGRPLDGPEFAPLFTLIEKLGLIVFMHPTSAVTSERFGMYGIHVLVGWPFETTLAVTRMIFNGLLERHPRLKLVLAHGGGNLVYLRGRLDSAYDATGWEADPYFRQHISQRPSAYLDRLYYDTCALSEDSNRFTIQTMGPERVVFGSDYPFDIGDPEGKRSVPVVDGLPPADREKVYRGNAQRLLADAGR